MGDLRFYGRENAKTVACANLLSGTGSEQPRMIPRTRSQIKSSARPDVPAGEVDDGYYNQSVLVMGSVSRYNGSNGQI